MKLGQEVTFTHSLKSTGNSIDNNIEFLSDELRERLHEDWMKVEFKARTEHQEMRGIIVGKRRVCMSGEFIINVDLYDDERLENITHYETIYLVACNLAGFKKVLPEDIGIVG